MLMLFDSFTRCQQVMAAIHAQPVEDLPHVVGSAVGGSHAGHVQDFVWRDEFIATSVILPKAGGIGGWRAKANALIAAHADAQTVIMFHNELPANQRDVPHTLINPDIGVFIATLGAGAALSDRDRAALAKALQLRRPPARSRAGRDAEIRSVFGRGLMPTVHSLPIIDAPSLEALMNAPLDQPQYPVQYRHHADEDNEMPDEDDDIRRALAASLVQEQPAPPPRAIKRSWQDVLRADAEPAAAGQPVCIACKEHRASICFLPCAHMPMCDVCARSWMEATPKCPVCRADCVDLVRPFLSGDAGGE
jgi:hypothetical protein